MTDMQREGRMSPFNYSSTAYQTKFPCLCAVPLSFYNAAHCQISQSVHITLEWKRVKAVLSVKKGFERVPCFFIRAAGNLPFPPSSLVQPLQSSPLPAFVGEVSI